MTGNQVLEVFTENRPVIKVEKNITLLKAGEEQSCVWYLKSGYVKQVVSTSKGKTVNFHIFKPGSVFPLMWLLTENGNRYDYRTVCRTELVKIPNAEFTSFLNAHPELVSFFMKRMLLGINGLLTRLESFIVDDVETRLLKLLTYLNDSYSEKSRSKDALISFTLTHEELAAWIGAARETTTFAIRRLIKKKQLSMSGKHYRILSTRRLKGRTKS
jgi:CRP-like cAMP-binding protein